MTFNVKQRLAVNVSTLPSPSIKALPYSNLTHIDLGLEEHLTLLLISLPLLLLNLAGHAVSVSVQSLENFIGDDSCLELMSSN